VGRPGDSRRDRLVPAWAVRGRDRGDRAGGDLTVDARVDDARADEDWCGRDWVGGNWVGPAIRAGAVAAIVHPSRLQDPAGPGHGAVAPAGEQGHSSRGHTSRDRACAGRAAKLPAGTTAPCEADRGTGGAAGPGDSPGPDGTGLGTASRVETAQGEPVTTRSGQAAQARRERAQIAGEVPPLPGLPAWQGALPVASQAGQDLTSAPGFPEQAMIRAAAAANDLANPSYFVVPKSSSIEPGLKPCLRAPGHASTARCDRIGNYRSSSGAWTPRTPRPEDITCFVAATKVRRAPVIPASSARMKRKCGKSLPRFHCW
jgi:hypothetical protein